MLDADFHGAPKLTTKPLLVMTPTADKVDLRGAFFSGRPYDNLKKWRTAREEDKPMTGELEPFKTT